MRPVAQAMAALCFLLAASTTIAFTPAPLFSSSRSTTRLFQVSVSEQEAMYIERANQNVAAKPEMVYTLVYNPYTEQEGVHTTDLGEGQHAMLVFESIEECNDFAFALGAEPSVPGQPVATPTPLEQIEVACQQMGWTLKVVPEPSWG